MVIKIMIALFFAVAFPGKYISCEEVRILEVDENGYALCEVESTSVIARELIQSFIENEMANLYEKALIEESYDTFAVTIKTKFGEVVAGALAFVHESAKSPKICVIRGFWTDKQYEEASLDVMVIEELVNVLKIKDCSLVIYPVVWQVPDDCKDFLNNSGFEVAALFFEPIESNSVVECVLKRVCDVDIVSNIDKSGYDIFVEDQWNEEFFQAVMREGEVVEDALEQEVDEEVASLDSQTEPDCHLVYVASHDGEIIAGGISHIIDYKDFGKLCCLWAVWVHEQYRGQGFGTKMMKALIDSAKSDGYTKMVLKTYEWEAKVFFEKLGFATHTKVIQLEDGVNFLPHYMSKTL